MDRLRTLVARIRPRHPAPTTLAEVIVVQSGLRRVLRWVVVAVSWFVVLTPVLTWIVVDAGANARKSNCRVVEATFLGYNHELTSALVSAGKSPKDKAAQDKQRADVKAFESDLASRVRRLMAGCDG